MKTRYAALKREGREFIDRSTEHSLGEPGRAIYPSDDLTHQERVVPGRDERHDPQRLASDLDFKVGVADVNRGALPRVELLGKSGVVLEASSDIIL